MYQNSQSLLLLQCTAASNPYPCSYDVALSCVLRMLRVALCVHTYTVCSRDKRSCASEDSDTHRAVYYTMLLMWLWLYLYLPYSCCLTAAACCCGSCCEQQKNSVLRTYHGKIFLVALGPRVANHDPRYPQQSVRRACLGDREWRHDA